MLNLRIKKMRLPSRQGRSDVSEESKLCGIADKHIEDSKVVHDIIYNDWRCKLFVKYMDGRQGNGCRYCSCGYLRR